MLPWKHTGTYKSPDICNSSVPKVSDDKVDPLSKILSTKDKTEVYYSELEDQLSTNVSSVMIVRSSNQENIQPDHINTSHPEDSDKIEQVEPNSSSKLSDSSNLIEKDSAEKTPSDDQIYLNKTTVIERPGQLRKSLENSKNSQELARESLIEKDFKRFREILFNHSSHIDHSYHKDVTQNIARWENLTEIEVKRLHPFSIENLSDYRLQSVNDIHPVNTSLDRSFLMNTSTPRKVHQSNKAHQSIIEKDITVKNSSTKSTSEPSNSTNIDINDDSNPTEVDNCTPESILDIDIELDHNIPSGPIDNSQEKRNGILQITYLKDTASDHTESKSLSKARKKDEIDKTNPTEKVAGTNKTAYSENQKMCRLVSNTNNAEDLSDSYDINVFDELYRSRESIETTDTTLNLDLVSNEPEAGSPLKSRLNDYSIVIPSKTAEKQSELNVDNQSSENIEERVVNDENHDQDIDSYSDFIKHLDPSPLEDKDSSHSKNAQEGSSSFPNSSAMTNQTTKKLSQLEIEPQPSSDNNVLNPQAVHMSIESISTEGETGLLSENSSLYKGQRKLSNFTTINEELAKKQDRCIIYSRSHSKYISSTTKIVWDGNNDDLNNETENRLLQSEDLIRHKDKHYSLKKACHLECDLKYKLVRKNPNGVQKRAPAVKLRRMSFADIHEHIPSYSPLVHQFDKIIKKVSVNGITKLKILIPKLKRLMIKDVDHIKDSGPSSNVNHSGLSKRIARKRSFKKSKVNKPHKRIKLNEEFTYKVIKFNHVPFTSPSSSPLSKSEQYKSKFEVPKHFTKLRNTKQIISKVQNKSVINKTIIGLKKSKRRRKVPINKHCKRHNNQYSLTEAKPISCNPITSNKQMYHSLKENFLQERVCQDGEVHTSNLVDEISISRDDVIQESVTMSDVTQNPGQDICKISGVLSLASMGSENKDAEGYECSNNGLVDTGDRSISSDSNQNSNIRRSYNEVEMNKVVISNLSSTSFLPTKNVNSNISLIHEPSNFTSKILDIKQEDEPFILELVLE